MWEGSRAGRRRDGHSASFLLLPAGSPARLHAGAKHMAWLTSAGLPAREGAGRRAPAQEGGGGTALFGLPLPHAPRPLSPRVTRARSGPSTSLPAVPGQDPDSGQGQSLVGEMIREGRGVCVHLAAHRVTVGVGH